MSSKHGIKQEVVIIGAGIIGLATAERLLTQGASVTILERNRVGQESSWAGGGILSPLCPWNYSEAVNRLTSYSANLFPAWAASLRKTTEIDPEYEKCGMLILPPYDLQTAKHWCAIHQIKTEQGTTPYSISAIQKMRTEACLDIALQSTLFLPHIAQIRNPRLLQALHHRIKLLGGKIIEHCPAENLQVANRQVQSIAAACGKFKADKYIVTAGAWSKEILGEYGLNLNIKPIRGQMLLFKFDAPPLRTILLKNNLYLIPRRDGHLLVGSTLEDVGFDKRTSRTIGDDLLARAQILLPLLKNMPIVKHWAGLRPARLNNIPIIGQHSFLKNLYINSGHFRYGVTMAPASAEILYNEITGAAQPIDTTPYQME